MNLISFGLNHLNQFLFWYNWSVCFYFYNMFLLYILYIIHILKYIVPYYQKSLVFPFFLKLFILIFNSFSTFKSLISDARWFIDLLDLPWRNHQIHCSNRLIFVKCKFRVLYVFFFCHYTLLLTQRIMSCAYMLYHSGKAVRDFFFLFVLGDDLFFLCWSCHHFWAT